MTFDDVLSVIKGKITNQPLVSIWRHYPEIDMRLEPLVEATIHDYNIHPSDLIKLNPHGRYPVVDFGCNITPGIPKHGDTGASSCKKCIVQTSDDWDKIIELDPLDGHYGMQLDFVKQVKKAIPGHPIMMTVFSPTMVARKLSGNKMPDHLFNHSESSSVEDALQIIDKVTTEFAFACIDSGADGIFAAVQEADRNVANSENEIKRLIELNKSFMASIKKKSTFTVLHLHGDDIMFQYAVKELNPTAVNWQDQSTFPSLLEAREFFNGGLLGGLEPNDVLDDKISNQIENALGLKDNIPLILAPGCVLLQGTKEETLTNIFNNFKKLN